MQIPFLLSFALEKPTCTVFRRMLIDAISLFFISQDSKCNFACIQN
nr:MAG TPA: hypothetical protein [Caudoviricetes sp.]